MKLTTKPKSLTLKPKSLTLNKVTKNSNGKKLPQIASKKPSRLEFNEAEKLLLEKNIDKLKNKFEKEIGLVLYIIADYTSSTAKYIEKFKNSINQIVNGSKELFNPNDITIIPIITQGNGQFGVDTKIGKPNDMTLFQTSNRACLLSSPVLYGVKKITQKPHNQYLNKSDKTTVKSVLIIGDDDLSYATPTNYYNETVPFIKEHNVDVTGCFVEEDSKNDYKKAITDQFGEKGVTIQFKDGGKNVVELILARLEHLRDIKTNKRITSAIKALTYKKGKQPTQITETPKSFTQFLSKKRKQLALGTAINQGK